MQTQPILAAQTKCAVMTRNCVQSAFKPDERYHIQCSLWFQLTVSVDICRVGMGGEKTLGVLPPEVKSMHSERTEYSESG